MMIATTRGNPTGREWEAIANEATYSLERALLALRATNTVTGMNASIITQNGRRLLYLGQGVWLNNGGKYVRQ